MASKFRMYLAFMLCSAANLIWASSPDPYDICLKDHLLLMLQQQKGFHPIDVKAKSGEIIWQAPMCVLCRYPFFDAEFRFGEQRKEWMPIKARGEGFDRKILKVGLFILFYPEKALQFADEEHLDFDEAQELVELLEPIWGADKKVKPNSELHEAVDNLLAKLFLREIGSSGFNDFTDLCSFLETHDLPDFTRTLFDLEGRKKIGKLPFSEDFRAQIALRLKFIEIAGVGKIKTFETTQSNLTQMQWTTLWAKFLADTLPDAANPSYFKKSIDCPETLEVPAHRFMTLEVHANGQDLQVPMCPQNPVEKISAEIHLAKLVKALNEYEEQHDNGYIYFISSEAEERLARSGGVPARDFPWGDNPYLIGD